MKQAQSFNLNAFYDVLRQVVESRSTTWRSVALETEIPSATLKRMSQGGCPDAAALAALAVWANLNLGDFVYPPFQRRTSGSLSAISRVLRSDPTLDPAAVHELERIIHAIYARLRSSRR